MQLTREALKALWVEGWIPHETDYEDLFDSLVFWSEIGGAIYTKEEIDQKINQLYALEMAGYKYDGVVGIADVKDVGKAKVYYRAIEVGAYPNCGGLTVAEGEVSILMWDGETWSKEVWLNLGEFAKKGDIPTNNKSLTNGAGYQTASDVEGLINSKNFATKSDIPTNNNSLTNGAGYQTASDVEGLVNSKNFATKSEIPTNNNSLTNGAGYQTASDVDTTVRDVLGEKNFATNARVDEVANIREVESSVEGNLMEGAVTSDAGVRGSARDSGRKVVDAMRNDGNVPSSRAVLAHLDKFNVIMGTIDGTITPAEQPSEALNKRYRNLMVAAEYVEAPNERGAMIPGWQYQIDVRDTYLNLGIVPPSSPDALKYTEPGDMVICKTAGRYTSTESEFVSSSGYGYPTYVVIQSSRDNTVYSVQNEQQFINIEDSVVNENTFSAKEDFLVEKIRVFRESLTTKVSEYLNNMNDHKYYFININLNQRWWRDGSDKFALTFLYDAIIDLFNQYYYLECIDLNVNNTNDTLGLFTHIPMNEAVGNEAFNSILNGIQKGLNSMMAASPKFVTEENALEGKGCRVRMNKVAGVNGKKDTLKFSVFMN